MTSTLQAPESSAPAGRITFSAVGGPGAARLDDGEVVGQRADIALRDLSRLFARGDGGGTIRIRGGAIVVEDGSMLDAGNTGPSDSQGGIEVDGDSVAMRGGAQLTANVLELPSASGRGGSVSVRADAVKLESGSFLTANTFAQGHAGSVAVTARDLEIRGGARIGSSSSAAGRAGAVTVEVGQLRIFGDGIDDVTGIRSDANRTSTETGDAGTVTVTAREIEIRSGGEIRSSTFGGGDAGTVHVEADRLLISGAGAFINEDTGFPALTGISSSVDQVDGEAATGAGGTVTVTADAVDLRADGKIRSVTLGQGRAGTVAVTADRLTLVGGGQISSSTLGQGTGRSGNVNLTVHGPLSISGQSRFRTASGGFPPSGVFASTESTSPDARAGGTVTVSAPVVRLADRGQISSGTSGGGDGGAIRVRAGVLELRNGGSISARSTGTGAAGAVRVSVDDRLLLLSGSEVRTNSTVAGGGRIRLRVGDAIVLRDSFVTTSVAGGSDRTAGNILIDPKVLVIDGSKILANAPVGFGGKVKIIADNILVPEGDFEALLERRDIDATGGDPTRNGTIVVNAPDVDLSGGLVVLEGVLLDAAAQLRARCGARRDIGASSFTGGRPGLAAAEPRRPAGRRLSRTRYGGRRDAGAGARAGGPGRRVVRNLGCRGRGAVPAVAGNGDRFALNSVLRTRFTAAKHSVATRHPTTASGTPQAPD